MSKNLFFAFAAIFQFSIVFGQYCNSATSNDAITVEPFWKNTSTYNSGKRAFNFTAYAGCTYEFQTCYNSTSDTYLRLYSTATGGSVLAQNDDNCNLQSKITWTCSTTGNYSILLTRVTSYSCGFLGWSTCYDYCNNLNANTFISYRVTTPALPSKITGQFSVCPSATGLTYSVENVSGMTYNWTLPSGWTKTAGGNTNSITVTAGSSGGVISVTATNTCGTSQAATLNVGMKPIPTANAGADDAICTGLSKNITATATVPSTAQLVAQFDGSDVTGWTTNEPNNWGTWYSTSAGGTIPEFGYTYQGTSANDASVISPVVNATNFNALNVSFRHYVDHYANSFSIRFETSEDNVNWTQRWASTVNADVAATTVNVDLAALNNKNFYVRFRFVGTEANINYWGIDDIRITGTYSAAMTYAWSPTTNLSSSTSLTTTANPTSSTTYTLTATSNGCSHSDAMVLTINPNNTAGSPSATPSICQNNGMTAVTIATTGATGISSASNLPTGVTASWSANSITIQGTPTASGSFSYSIPLTGGCGTVNASGSMTVSNPVPAINTAIGGTLQTNDYVWTGTTNASWSQVNNWRQYNGTILSSVATVPNSSNTNRIYVVHNSISPACIFNAGSVSLEANVSASDVFIGTGAAFGLGSRTLNVSGTFTNQGTFNAGTGMVNFNGGTQTIPALTYYSLSSGAAGVKTLGGNINVSGSLQLNNGTIRLNGNTLTYSGNDFQFTNGNMDASALNSKLKFTNSQTVTIPSGIFNGSVYNLEVAGTANVVADNTFTISNNLNLVSSNFVISDGLDLTVQGSITKSSGSAISLGATQSGKIIFEGTSIDMGTTDNIRFNRVGAGDIQVNGNITVNGQLELIKGIVALGTNNITLNGSLGTIGGGAYIKTTSTGKFIRKTAATGVEYLFPVGQTYYTPIKITFTGGVGASSTLTSRVVSGLHPDADPSVTNYARTGYYWEMNSSNMTNPTYTVTLKYDDNTIINAGGETELDLRPAKYSSSTGWLSSNQCTVCFEGTTIGTSTLNTTTNEIVWSGVTGFSDFAGFGQGNGSPLPVELVSFSANCENEGVQLSWQTASEFNASHFTVEKSTDGFAWDKIGEVSAAGTSNSLLNYGYFDRNAISGINYYRLIQVDFDGTEKEYAPIMANCASDASKTWMSYPNPSDAGFQVVCDYPELIGDATLTILDASGKLVGLQAITLNEGINLFVVNQELTPGIYFLNISNSSKSTPVLRHAVR